MSNLEVKSPGWTVLPRAAAAAVAAASMAMVVAISLRADEPIAAVTPLTLGVAVTALVLAVAGAIVLATSRHRDLALLSAIASMLLITALVLSIFGVLVLPLVILTIVVLGRRAAGRRRIAIALLSGPVIAVGVAALLAIWVQPPLVECQENGVSTTSRPWWDSESGSGTGGGGADRGGSMSTSPGSRVSTGTLQTPSGTYQYRCDGNELVEFRRV